MFTVEDWRRIRPGSGKDSGIAGALKLWEAHCSAPPATFDSYEQFDNAFQACQALGEAFTTAVKAMKADDGSKAQQATELLKKSTREIFQFRTDCQQLLAAKNEEMERRIAEAEQLLGEGMTKIEGLFNLARSQQQRVNEMAHRLGDRPKLLPEAAIKEARKELTRWQGSLANLKDMSKEELRALRVTNAIAYWRAQGAEKILAAHTQSRERLPELSHRFQEFSHRFNAIEELVQEIARISDTEAVTITKLLTSTNQWLNELGSAVGVLQELKKTLQLRHNSIKDIITKRPSVGVFKADKKAVDEVFKKQQLEGIKKQRHGCDSQIEQLEIKIQKLQRFQRELRELFNRTIQGLPPYALESELVRPLFSEAEIAFAETMRAAEEWMHDAAQICKELLKYKVLVDDKKYDKAKAK